jgi:hypothetical protein
MSFKEFSAAQDAPSKDGSGDKSKAAPVAGKPAPKSDKTPADVAPATKS